MKGERSLKKRSMRTACITLILLVAATTTIAFWPALRWFETLQLNTEAGDDTLVGVAVVAATIVFFLVFGLLKLVKMILNMIDAKQSKATKKMPMLHR